MNACLESCLGDSMRHREQELQWDKLSTQDLQYKQCTIQVRIDIAAHATIGQIRSVVHTTTVESKTENKSVVCTITVFLKKKALRQQLINERQS